MTGNDANSKIVNPLFATPGGVLATDYMPSETDLANGIAISVVTDYNGASRNATPTIGAFEMGACTNPSSGGTITAPQSGCNPFDPLAFTSTAPATGHIGPSIEYKWQESVTSALAGFSDIVGANALTYNPCFKSIHMV